MRDAIKYKSAQARYTDANGNVSIVQIHGRGLALQPGAIYYNSAHDGKLKCVCCEAPVKAHPARVSSGGSSGAGSVGYFRPDRKHDPDCIVPLRNDPLSRQKIDYSKGYRIHINTLEFSELFNKRSGAYEVSPGGKIKITDRDLRDRDAYTVTSPRDLLNLMRKGNFERLLKSKVIFGNEAIDWEEFCALHQKRHSMAKLAERALGRDKDNPVFGFVEVRPKKPHRFHSYDTSFKVECERISNGYDDNGRPMFIEPSITVGKGALAAFMMPGHYMYMGHLHANRFEKDNIVIDYLNIFVPNSNQVVPVNIANLAAEAKANANGSNRKARAVPDPQQQLNFTGS